MADTVTVFGHTVKKWQLAGGVIVGAAAIWAWRREQKASAAAAAQAGDAAQASSSPSGDAYPPDGTTGNPSDPYSTDPATGQTYGDEGAGGYTGTGDSGLGGYYGGTGLYGAGSGEGPGFFTSNAYWAQYCEQYLGSSGDDSISAAIGAYIDGAPVDPSQVSIIEQAIAIGGYPPIAGTNGHPPSINTSGSGNGGGAKVRVPNVVGQPQEAAYAILAEAGLHASGPSPVAGKTLYVDSQSPAAGAGAARGSTVDLRSSARASSGGGKGDVTVPDVVGKEQAAAYAELAAAGLKASGAAPVKGKTRTVTAQSPKAGARAARGSTVRLTSKLS